jgi:hypothetical protein
MAPLLLGAALLSLILVLLRAMAFADPKLLVKSLRYAAAGACGAFAVFLAVAGRWAPAMVLGSMAWGLATRGHPWPSGWAPFSGGPSSRSRPKQNETTSVRTAWLEMELDHDTGAMRGTVLRGTHAAKTLASLGRGALLAFYLEAGTADAETARLLEAYMDRTLGTDWRAEVERERSAAQSGTAMSREEALKILGLQQGATEDQIRAAHRRLMMQNHPDRGGSDYIAAKINEAKNVLFGH